MRNHQFIGDFGEQDSESYHVERGMWVVNTRFRFDGYHIRWNDDEQERQNGWKDACPSDCWPVFTASTSVNSWNEIIHNKEAGQNSEHDDENPRFKSTENLRWPNFRTDEKRYQMDGDYSVLRFGYINLAKV